MELLYHFVTIFRILLRSVILIWLLEERPSYANKSLQGTSEKLTKVEVSGMYRNISNEQHIDIDSSSSDTSSDDLDEYLHSGLLESEPNTDSSGTTIPFHKLNRTSRRKNKYERFLSNFSSSGISSQETATDPTTLSGVIESFLDNSHSDTLTQNRSTLSKEKLQHLPRTSGYPLKSRSVNSSFKITNKSRAKIVDKNRRRKRQVELPLPLPVDQRNSDFSPTCGAGSADEEITATPLKCYQCRSTSKSKSEYPGDCDDEQWKYLRESEKYYLRIRCPENRGHYCVKSVGDKGGGERRTVRGCYGAGPLATKDGKHIELREGCISYIDGGYWTKTCFCKHEMCNTASDNNREGDGSLISAIIVCWAIFMYAFCCASISR